MNSEKPIVEFLSRDENLSLAIDVADAMDDVYIYIEKHFLDELWLKLSAAFDKSGLKTNWKLQKSIVQPSEKRRYASVFLSLASKDNTGLYYLACIWREGNEYSLYYGLEWECEGEKEPDHFRSMKSSSKDDLLEFLQDREFEANKWTLGWKAISSFTTKKELMLDLTKRRDELSSAAAIDLWALVEKTHTLVENINQTLND